MRATFSFSIRQLTTGDVASLMDLSGAAGWNQTPADWMILLRLSPEGCLGIEFDGVVVATATVVCYGDRLAWVGMVLTHPEYRQRGFARCLVKCVLAIARADNNNRSIKLDATDQGRQLYESLGFREEQPIQRWSNPGVSFATSTPGASVGIPSFDLDREAFGANRASLLKLLTASTPAFVNATGFAIYRAGARASYIGPCVARTVQSAKNLIESCLCSRKGPWYWDLFPSNIDAVRCAEELNFKAERTLVRMVKGPDLRGCESMIYAGGGFELG